VSVFGNETRKENRFHEVKDAESRVARLDYAAALDRFRAAQAFSRSQAAANHINASIIDTRQRQVELLLQEQTLDR
jgi:hypothetical protein